MFAQRITLSLSNIFKGERRVAALTFILGGVGTLLIWYIVGELGHISPNSGIPKIQQVVSAFLSWIQAGYLKKDVGASLGRVLPGIGIGSILGIITGILSGRIKWLYRIIGPPMHIFRAFPPVALVPFFLMVMGINETSKIVIVSLGVFFPVWINAHEGATQVPSELLEVGKDLNISKFQIYKRVIYYSALPYICAGIRTGIGMAYVMVFIGEWIGANSGIGYRLSVAHVVGASDHMVVGLLFLGILSYSTDLIFRSIVRWRYPWMESTKW